MASLTCCRSMLSPGCEPAVSFSQPFVTSMCNIASLATRMAGNVAHRPSDLHFSSFASAHEEGARWGFEVGSEARWEVGSLVTYRVEEGRGYTTKAIQTLPVNEG